MTKKPNKKKRILAVVAVLVVLAIGAGIWFAAPGSAEPVGVYPFDYLGMTEYWGDNQESYGPVTSDNIQTVFLTDTQIVTEIKVHAGDTVKKGDVLMTFDTTLSSLSLERKRLDMEKKKLALEIAQRELGDILMLEPMEEPEWTPPTEEEEEVVDLGVPLTGDYQISESTDYDGSAEEKALICWLKDTTAISDQILETLRQTAEELQKENAEDEESDGEEGGCTDPDDYDPEKVFGPKRRSSASALPEVLESFWEGLKDHFRDPEKEETPSDPEETPDDGEDADGEDAEEDDPNDEASGDENDNPDDEETGDDKENPDQGEEDNDEETESTEPEEAPVKEFYVVFKTTQGNMSLGTRLSWVGMHVTMDDNGEFHFQFYDASAFTDHTILLPEQEVEIVIPEMDFDVQYTLAQIVQMKAAKEKEIKQLTFDLKMAETEYKIMQRELEDGNVYAEVDGQVVTVLPEEEARMSRQPILKVSGGGGFYVQCSVSELEMEKMEIGMEVTVNDWNTGMTYTGTVDSMGDFPSADGYWNGMGNPNTTYYPFTVFIDGSADLQTHSYVSVMYSTGSAEHGIYLQNPFLRTEQGSSYVYVLGAGGKLEKREVVTGKSLYGSYTEILSGITAEDLIAFPYGKNVKAGAPAEERDISELYSY